MTAHELLADSINYWPRWESRSEVYSGEGNPNWQAGGVELTCRHCGEDYTVKQAGAYMSKYCSDSCYISNRTGEDHPRHNPDTERI
jgi:hypothetical protein